jgi:hypothetical protein
MPIILRVSAVSVIPPILHVNFYLNRSKPGGLQKSNVVVNIFGHEKEFRVSCMNTSKNEVG